jgi:hypothetical protein
MTPNEIETFQKVSYTVLEPEQLTWYEWFFGKNEPEIEADPKSKDAKYKVTEQIKNSINHKLIKKHQSDTVFPHTQSIVNTDLKMEDTSTRLPSPYQTPIFAPQITPATILNTMTQNKPQIPAKKLHPSIAERRKNRFTPMIKDDLDI